MPTNRRLLAFVVPLLTSAACASPAQAATRTWISGVGDDVNPCSRTAPCKTLAGAISKTDEGGEINALDPGPFGVVSITKSLTIDLRPAEAGVLNTTTNGINVNAGADDRVVLRGLDIYGAAAAAGTCPYGGVNGVRVLSAGSVVIQDSTIASQNVGVLVAPTMDPVDVTIDHSSILNTCTNAVSAVPTGTATARVVVHDSFVSNTGTAIGAGPGASVFLPGSTIFGNTTAFAATGSGAINAYDDTRLIGNGGGETPTSVLASLAAPTPTPAPTPEPAVVAAAAPVPTAAPVVTPTPIIIREPAVCTVPRLVGKTEDRSETALENAGCDLGAVKTKSGPASKVGRVVSQTRTAGIQTAAGGKVGITIGKRR